MKKSATDVMEEIVFSAIVDAFVALKAASRGLPNALLRDLNAVHPNTTLADLPTELQTAIAASARAAFVRLQKAGYTVASGDAAPPRGGPDRPRPADPGRPRPSGPRGDGPRPGGPRNDGARPPRPGGGRRPPPRKV